MYELNYTNTFCRPQDIQCPVFMERRAHMTWISAALWSVPMYAENRADRSCLALLAFCFDFSDMS